MSDSYLVTKICPKCNSSFEVKELINTKARYKSRTFCSRSCANSHKRTKESKELTSKSLRKYYSEIGGIKSNRACIKCLNCNKWFEGYSYRKYCSPSCQQQCPIMKNTLSTKLKGKTGGIRNMSGHGLRGIYKGIKFQSSWELAWIVYNLDHEIQFRRCTEYFWYEFEGKHHKYFPDFFLEETQTYVEIKGFITPIVQAKMNSITTHPLIVITENKIDLYLDYAKSKNIPLTKKDWSNQRSSNPHFLD